MSEREKKSPKFYVADGIMLRMRESIAYVLDDPKVIGNQRSRYERALSNRTGQVLETLMICGIITPDEFIELKDKLWDLLGQDEIKRQEKSDG